MNNKKPVRIKLNNIIVAKEQKIASDPNSEYVQWKKNFAKRKYKLGILEAHHWSVAPNKARTILYAIHKNEILAKVIEHEKNNLKQKMVLALNSLYEATKRDSFLKGDFMATGKDLMNVIKDMEQFKKVHKAKPSGIEDVEFAREHRFEYHYAYR